MHVGFDIDGVSHIFGDGVKRYFFDRGLITQEQFDAPILDWYFYRAWGINDSEFVQYCHDGVDAGVIFFHGDPTEGAVEGMNSIYEAGHRLTIITDRSFGSDEGKSSRRTTFKWLREHEIKFHDIIFTADKAKIPVDTMIDDKLENYDQMSAVGTKVYLLNQPWNHVPNDNRTRINTIDEYVRAVELAHYEQEISQ